MSWIAPNEAYERATSDFIAGILVDNPATTFRSDFEPLSRIVAACGVWNSLSQTILKITSPGVPDIYQGTELWDFSLVDPDNRLPVNFADRCRLLAELPKAASDTEHKTLIDALVQNPVDGRIKLWLIASALRFRRENPDLFTVGEYHALEVNGERKEHVLAFARRHKDQAVIVVAPRFTAAMSDEPGPPPLDERCWRDTTITLPPSLLGDAWHNVLTGEHLQATTVGGKCVIPVVRILHSFPVGLLRKDETAAST